VTKYAYFHNEIVPIEQAKVSIMTNTFNYGTGCFGGIRGYWNEERQQLYVFRIFDHYRRFLDSARVLLAKLDYTPESLAQITLDLLVKEGWTQNCYIRPIAYKAEESIAVKLHDLKDDVTIFSQPVGNYLPIQGISVGTSSWRRVDDTAIPARGKIIGSYANSALIKSEAQLNGYDDAIVLNQDGHISEGSAANFMMIRNGAVVTPPTSSNILEGITRRTIMELVQNEMGLPV
jgi:branched-chain amino acid aminotransferase